MKEVTREEVVNDWNIYKDIKCLVCWFDSRYHPIERILTEIYVIADTHGLRVVFMRIT